MTILEVLQWIAETEGRIFSIRFRKRTPPHDVREMVARTGVKKGLVEFPTKPGLDFKKHDLVPVYDMQKQAYRSIPKEGILAIKVNGEWEAVIHD